MENQVVNHRMNTPLMNSQEGVLSVLGISLAPPLRGAEGFIVSAEDPVFLSSGKQRASQEPRPI